MNDKLQDSLAEVVSFLLQWAKSTQSFVAEQAPLVVREAIAYGRAYETWQEIAWLGMLVICLVTFHRSKSRANWDHDGPSDWDGAKTIISGIGTVVMFFGLLTETPDFLKVWFAPRIYLLEWAAKLLNHIKQ